MPKYLTVVLAFLLFFLVSEIAFAASSFSEDVAVGNCGTINGSPVSSYEIVKYKEDLKGGHRGFKVKRYVCDTRYTSSYRSTDNRSTSSRNSLYYPYNSLSRYSPLASNAFNAYNTARRYNYGGYRRSWRR